MVYIQAEIRRGFLRQVAEGAKKTASTLESALLAVQGSIFTPNFQKGRLLVSTSGSGQSGSFAIGISGAQFTQENVFALTEQLLEVLTDTTTNGLAVDTGLSSDTNNLFTVMCQDDRLAGVRSEMLDVTSLNIPSIGGVPGAGA